MQYLYDPSTMMKKEFKEDKEESYYFGKVWNARYA